MVGRMASLGSLVRKSALSCRLAFVGLFTLLAIIGDRNEATAAQPTKSIASINLCTDQLLLALVDRSQIAGVSAMATDPSLSFLAKPAQGLEKVRGNAEELLNLKAALVLTGSYDKRLARQMLKRRKIKFLTIRPWQNLADGRSQIRMVAARLGAADRGRQLLRGIAKARDKLVTLARPDSKGRTFIVLQRRGYILRQGVVVELLELAGMRNHSARIRSGASGIASLEEIVFLKPDYLVVESTGTTPEDQGTAKLVHPALSRLYPPARRLVIPARLAICAGPSTPHLINHIASEIRRKVQ